MTNVRFEDKVVVVTGASRGIGESIALAFANEGAKVIGVARSVESGKGFEAMPFDFGAASVADINGLVKGVLDRHGRVDVLVNNAGIIRRAPAATHPEQDWDDVLKINLKAPFYLTQSVGRWWIETGMKRAAPDARLKIVNIASMLSFQGGINVISYAASKHGIAGITKALANEWAAHRINVNAIAPGYIATENTKPLREDPVRNKAIKDRIPQGDWADPSQIAGGVMYLASSPDSDYCNGAILNIDGGWLAR
jgi:2-deoxy-D-gluconate 3-dehydrogenase